MFTNPSLANRDRNIMAYATRDVAQGRKMAVLKNPINRSFGLFNREAKAIPRTSIIGTWIIRYKKQFLMDWINT